MPEMIVYFDTCIFIELLQKQNQKRFDACEALRAQGERGEIEIVMSSVAIAETIKIGVSPDTQKESDLILEFFEHPYFKIRQCDRFIGESAHRLNVAHSLTPLDGIHLATALSVGASVLYTYDGEKKRKKGKLITLDGKLGDPALRIMPPPNPDKGTLLDPRHQNEDPVETIKFDGKASKAS